MLVGVKKVGFLVTSILLRTQATLVFTNPYTNSQVSRQIPDTNRRPRRRVRPDWQRS